MRHRAPITAAVIVAAVAAVAVQGTSSSGAPAGPQRPNFLLIVVDDQAMNTFSPRFMPDTYRWIVRRGTKFVDGLAAPPDCCPDRAGILTGQYPHNNGVFANDPGYAGLVDKRNTLPVWLQRAGYRTGFVGKFLNNYRPVAHYAPAPGFDFWFAYDGLTRYFNYTMSDQGAPRFFGSDRRDYTTSVFTRKAVRFLRQPSRRPFFLWLAYNAPHASRFGRGHCDGLDAIPATTKSYLRFRGVRLPRPPSYDEADVSDKPRAIAALPPIDARHVADLTRRYRCTLAAMRTVDLGINRIMRLLRRRRELRRTIVVYMSDNGFFFGQHRIQFGKWLPYEPALRVPLAVRIPDAFRTRAAPPRVAQVVSEQDIAPTLLDYAGGAASCARPTDCRQIDGRSLRPTLTGEGGWPKDRGTLVELNDAGIEYSAIRTRRYLYVEYADGERELYDLRADPSELQNRAGTPSYGSTEATLSARLAALRACKGHRGAKACE